MISITITPAKHGILTIMIDTRLLRLLISHLFPGVSVALKGYKLAFIIMETGKDWRISRYVCRNFMHSTYI